jgi:acyl-CoA synthetase (AMP-forming)/AMP-acid ligase II
VVLIDTVENRTWTVQNLSDQSIQFGGHLASYRPGERIAFRLPNGSDWLALFLAIQRAGLVAVPLDAGLPKAGCLEIARRLKARALYLDRQFIPFEKKPFRAGKSCCVKVTSGSDGIPDAVECSAENLIADGGQIITTMKIRPSDRNLAVIPLGHSYGLGNLVMPLLLQGTSMVCGADFLPRQLIDWIKRHRVTVFPGVPALFRVLAAIPPGTKLAPLRTVISAGAILQASVAQAFFQRFGLKIHNFYGSSETGGICYDRTGSASMRGRSVGKPLDGVSISLHRGRIKVRSAAVASRGGQWLLNDIGQWNHFNELVLLGRLGQTANIGGKKVHPLEVERLLRSLPHVTDAAVWIQPIEGRDYLAAGVETTLSRAKVENDLAAQLPAWKLPKGYIIAKKLPRTGRGKIDLSALRERINARIF